MAFDLSKKYPVVLADPPWSYHGQQDKWGAAAKFYDLLDDDALLEFPIKDVMSSKSVLFLWATSPRLDFAIKCIESWGLYYRGVGFVWTKTTKAGVPIGAQGVRPSIVKPLVEFVLCGSTQAKGRPLPLCDEGIVQTIFAPKSEHSAKPVEVQDRIDRLYPDLDKLELFARQERPGWDSWGEGMGDDKWPST